MTVSESKWPELRDRYQQIMDDYVNARPFSIDDSEIVFSARLFGLGYRGDELRTEIWLANTLKMEKRSAQHSRPVSYLVK